MKKIVACYAHPDDETFSIGGAVAHFAAEGVPAVLVCTTRGEVGQISDPSLATPETLPQVREAELRCAADIVGFEELILLGYRDSGMEGTPENEDPRAFVNAEPDKVVEQIVTVLRREQPSVVITFGPDGGYGHPDHIAIHHWTLDAVTAAADPTRYPDAGEPWRVDRIFYSVIPRSFFHGIQEGLKAQGADQADWEQFAHSGWPDEEVDLVLDVSAVADVKLRALHCHRTQFGEENAFRKVGAETLLRLLSSEHFVLAHPAPQAGESVTDLFPPA